MALSLCSEYGILWNCKIHLRESIYELGPGKDVRISSWARHIFLMVDQKAVKGTGYSYNTWAGLGHLLAEKPSSEKEKLCVWCCYCFQALFGFQKEEKLPAPHRNDCVVPKLKPGNPTPLVDASSAFTEANVRCKGAAVISGRRKRITPFHLEVIQSTGSYLSELLFGEFISLLVTRLHQSDCIPIWSAQVCGRFNLKPARVIVALSFILVGRIAGGVVEVWYWKKK